MKNVILALLAIVLFYGTATATNKIIFNKLSFNDGLSHSDVNAVVQDNYGFMWFATYNGLCRFDGKNMVVFRADNSGLANNRVLSLQVGQDSLLYIGTEGGGLNVYDANSNTIIQVHHSFRSGQVVESEIVNGFLRDSDHNIWICSNNGISLVKKQGSAIGLVHYSNTGVKENILSADELDKDRLLLGTNMGLMVFNKKDHSYTRILREALPQHVNVVKKKDATSFLIGTSDGLYEYHAPSGKLSKQLSQGVLSILVDKLKNVWVGTSNEGLHLFNFNMNPLRSFRSDISKQNSLSGNVIRTLYDDDSGVLWIGTIGEGISKTNIVDKKIELYSLERWKKGALIQTNVISFFEDKNRILWIGTRADGLTIMNLGTREIKKVEALGDISLKDVSSFYQDRSGTMWIGTWQGLYRVSASQVDNIWNKASISVQAVNMELSHSNISIFKMIEDNEKHVWISTSNGVYQYVPGVENYHQGRFINYRHDSHNVNSIQDDFVTHLLWDKYSAGKTIWVGTRSGLSKISFDGSKAVTERIALSKDKGEFVSIVHQDRKKNLWIATLGGGLHKLVNKPDRSGLRVTTYNSDTHAFPNNELESLLEDAHGNFWIGGPGIVKFNPNTGSVKHYSSKDRLQSNSFKIMSTAKLSSGEMVFGGVNGFNIFNPDSIVDNPVKPKVVLTGLKIFSEEVHIGDTLNEKVVLENNIFKTERIELPHNRNSLTFEFAALHFIAPAYNQYRYKLVGFDNEWRFARGSQNVGVYANLRHGEYKFIVYGANSDGVWSEIPAVLAVSILPPFWLTGWAYAFYIVLTALLLYLFRRSALKRLTSQHVLEMEKRLREEEQRTFDNKIRFFTDISHEIKTPLSLISVPIEELLSTPQIGKTTRSKLGLVNRNVRRLMNLVEQILDFRKFESNMMSLAVREVNIRTFIQELVQLFQPLADSKGVELILCFENEKEAVYLDTDKMEKVVINLLSNAFKYSPRNGKIEIRCKDTSKNYCVSVHNSGISINEHELNKIFEPFYQADNSSLPGGVGIGLSLSKYIVDQHHGEIWAEPGEEGGTTFFVRLMKGSDHFKGDLRVARRGFEGQNIRSVGPGALIEEPARYEKRSTEELSKEATIVLVEDNRDFRDYIEEVLHPKYHVIAIDESTRAFDRIIAEQPDLVITDWMMPEMTGIELCGKLKTDAATLHIPVMMLTARSLLTHEIDGYETGADAYISKPFDLKLFKTRVDALIQAGKRLKGLFMDKISVEPSKISVSTYDQTLMSRCLEIIEKHMENPTFGVDELCKEVAVSRSQLYRKVKSLTGLSTVQFIRSIRLKRAAQFLEKDNACINEVMLKTGITNPSYFSKIFKEEFGCLPKQYLNKRKEHRTEGQNQA